MLSASLDALGAKVDQRTPKWSAAKVDAATYSRPEMPQSDICSPVCRGVCRENFSRSQ